MPAALPCPVLDCDGLRCSGHASPLPLTLLGETRSACEAAKMSESRRLSPKSTGASLRLKRFDGDSLILRMMLCRTTITR